MVFGDGETATIIGGENVCMFLYAGNAYFFHVETAPVAGSEQSEYAPIASSKSANVRLEEGTRYVFQVLLEEDDAGKRNWALETLKE